MVAGTGGGSAPSLHVLASLTSIATCLFVVAHLSPHFQGYLGSQPAAAGSRSHRRMEPGGGGGTSTIGGPDGSSSGSSNILSSWNDAASLAAAALSAAAEEGSLNRSSPSTLDSCLRAVGDGAWRLVTEEE